MMSLSSSRAASHVVTPDALIDLLVGEAFSLRRGAVDRAWIAWLMDSIPGIGPPETFRNVCAVWRRCATQQSFLNTYFARY